MAASISSPRPRRTWRGCTRSTRRCWPGAAGKQHHVVATVDGGPKIITFVIDGKLCDGGEARQFGWGRFNPNFRSAAGDKLRTGPGMEGQVTGVRLYGRALRISEAVRAFR